MPLLMKLDADAQARIRDALADVVKPPSYCVAIHGPESDGLEVDRHEFEDHLAAVTYAEQQVQRGFGSATVWNGSTHLADFS